MSAVAPLTVLLSKQLSPSHPQNLSVALISRIISNVTTVPLVSS